MALIKFLGSQSTGIAFETGETRSVNVTVEGVSSPNGFEGDTITYTATILDSITSKLPATFVATLKINGTALITDQVFDASVYSQATGLLTLDFIVPAGEGTFTVKLEWAEQQINV